MKMNKNKNCAQEIPQVKVPQPALSPTGTSPNCTPPRAKIPQLPAHQMKIPWQDKSSISPFFL